MAKRAYDAKSISVLSQLDGVRAHPGMYLGDIESSGTLQCFKEIVDNATDELKECGGGRVLISISNSVVTVADEGRGIPVDIHPKTKRSALETVLTRLHAGAKSGNKTAYGNRTIGVHGVGASVVNALSKRLTAWSYRNGKWWRIDFANGVVSKGLRVSRPTKSYRRGTVIEYELDTSIMKSPLKLHDARQLCNIVRHFSPVDIEYSDNEKSLTMLRRQPIDLLKRTLKRDELDVVVEPMVLSTDSVRLVCCWTNATDSLIDAHVSGASVPSGTHVHGLEEAIVEAVSQAAPREAKACGNVLIGLRATIDVTVDQPSFSGQAKTNLKTSSAKTKVIDAVVAPLTKHLRRNRIATKAMLEHATRVSKIDEHHAELKQLAKAADVPRGKMSFPKGFVAALSYPPEKRELLLCEGKSAKGSLKYAKMPWQEILPLRGKMANVINKSGAISKSEVVSGILASIGYDPRKPDKPTRVGKVAILADADNDGHHIAVLLLTIFQRVMPSLLQEKRVFVVNTPLFEAMTTKGEMVVGDVLSEMEKEYGRLTSVNRMKGLGGCGVPLLRKFACDPATRTWQCIAAPSSQESKALVELMGSDSSARKKLLGATTGKQTKGSDHERTARNGDRGSRSDARAKSSDQTGRRRVANQSRQRRN